MKKKSKTDIEIEKHLVEVWGEENPQRYVKDGFWKIFNDMTIIGWQKRIPIEFNGYAVIFLTPSPQHKGDRSTVFYDYMPLEKFKAERAKHENK